MTYRERREAKAERLWGWASKREARAAATFAADEPMTSDHAFNTQPGHIPARARLIARHEREFASLAKAESMGHRADGIAAQLATSIYSDDPDAVDALRSRIASLEAERDRVKAYNASCRKGQRDLSILDEHQRADLLHHIAAWGDFQCKGGAFPGYHLSGLSANIARNRQRLAGLTREAA